MSDEKRRQKTNTKLKKKIKHDRSLAEKNQVNGLNSRKIVITIC